VALDLCHINECLEGLRNLCLGRVLLKEDYVAEALEFRSGM